MTDAWWRSFKTRYPDLSTRLTKPLDIRRAKATQPKIIEHLFKLTRVLTKSRSCTGRDRSGRGCQRCQTVGPKGTYNNTLVMETICLAINVGSVLTCHVSCSFYSRKKVVQVKDCCAWACIHDADM